MATDIPSSNASILSDEKMAEVSGDKPCENGTSSHPLRESASLERIGSQNKSTEANIFPERVAEAEADLEKNGVVPKPTPVVGGVNPADFPDGGLEVGDIRGVGSISHYLRDSVLFSKSSVTCQWLTLRLSRPGL
jgi:hypothetical protein